MILFKKIASSGKYHDDLAIRDLLTYITRKDKTPTETFSIPMNPCHILSTP